MTPSDLVLISVAIATLINQWLIAVYNKRAKQKSKAVVQKPRGDARLRVGGIVLGLSTLMGAGVMISYAFDSGSPTRWDVLKISLGTVLFVLTVRDVSWLVLHPVKDV